MLPEVNDLVLERDGDLLTIWFNRPEVKNALSDAMAGELAAVLEALPSETDIRFVVLRGKGGALYRKRMGKRRVHFCTWADGAVECGRECVRLFAL